MGMTGDLQALIGNAPGRLRTLHAAVGGGQPGAVGPGGQRRVAELADVDAAEIATVHDLVPAAGDGDLVPAAGTGSALGGGLGGSPSSAARDESRHELLRDHLSEMGVDPDTVDLDDPAQVRAALRRRAE